MYNPTLVQPMREELTTLGVKEMTSPEDVKTELDDFSGTALVVVNSVCGCAAGAARPAVAIALRNEKLPEKLLTVFAGQDKEATDKARSYFTGYNPSSPSMGLLKEGQIVGMIQRQDIEGFSAEQISKKLTCLLYTSPSPRD